MSKTSEALKGLKKAVDMAPVAPESSESVLDHLNNKKPRGKWGGARKGAGGVKPTNTKTLIRRGIKQWIDDHGKEDLKVTVRDPITGKTRVIQKTRLMLALEKLYKIGMEGDGSPDALDKWLNRILGRPVQPIAGDEDAPMVLRIDF